MINPESTRLAWVLFGVGILFILTAAVLTAADLATRNGAGPVNLITFACGGWIIYLGLRSGRRARDHRRFMEHHRSQIARLTDPGR
jgi:threonine/homoserine/homoserine lactone efflux protein